ncbi:MULTISPECIES: hypothetical protein [unclassified Duganella]|uniref:hypothetical protein n=1 Tax=unclassified Duganella TaxID=2636909 RepID=UPI000E344C76|nr:MULTISPECIES: hypothetical protein [unclassified Duganella]RFP11931.1 hypothetical protein D0T23_18355 [Duganella sp. BJB475]RFP30059.1 hypothetical protein D0T21_19625 [Duganella sp. BJB476]
MPIIEPITLTLAELASRWNKTSSQLIEQGLPMYFYFDGLVFDFSDKWHRANGDVNEQQDLEAHQLRLSTVDLDLQRQALHKRGLLKLTQWEDALSDDDLRNLQAESDRLHKEVERLTALVKERNEERQRHVRNGLLRAAPRTLRDIAQHGKTKFPQFAFMPNSPGGNEKIAGGAVVALEDGFPAKTLLTADDLVIAMLDVRAVEASDKT